jgi:glutathione synthase/RimK-type ligase-like ATP-grasp enzyme
VVGRLSGRVALATCAEIPDGDDDFPALIEALRALGIDAEAAVWDDPAVGWGQFDVVLPRSTWDYAERRDAFLAWAASVPRVLNPLRVLEWNTDKQRYLTDLAAAGVPIVPTGFVEPGGELVPQEVPFVVKPAVSAGGRSSARFDPTERDGAQALVARIHAEGRTAMVQPYLADRKEKALVYLDGAYSHAVRRRVPLPAVGDSAVFYLDEELDPADSGHTERRIAEAALACAPDALLYGRVDLLGDAVLELEIAEPSLYLAYGEGATERFAAAISHRLRINPETGRTANQ